MSWKVYLTRSAYRRLKKLPGVVQDLVELAIVDLEDQGLSPLGWNTLKTGADEYRLRLNYRYRMRYRVLEKNTLVVEVFYVGHRKDAYRDLG